MSDINKPIVNLNEDKSVTDKRAEINKLRQENTKYRKIVNNKTLATNVRDEYLSKIEENEFMINEMLSEMKQPKIVPITKVSLVSQHVDSKKSSFGRSSVRF